MGKSYRSEAAKKLAEQRRKNAPRESKKFKNGSNPHHGGSRGQSGQPKQR
jgi:hypothetical protein